MSEKDVADLRRCLADWQKKERETREQLSDVDRRIKEFGLNEDLLVALSAQLKRGPMTRGMVAHQAAESFVSFLFLPLPPLLNKSHSCPNSHTVLHDKQQQRTLIDEHGRIKYFIAATNLSSDEWALVKSVVESCGGMTTDKWDSRVTHLITQKQQGNVARCTFKVGSSFLAYCILLLCSGLFFFFPRSLWPHASRMLGSCRQIVVFHLSLTLPLKTLTLFFATHTHTHTQGSKNAARRVDSSANGPTK